MVQGNLNEKGKGDNSPEGISGEKWFVWSPCIHPGKGQGGGGGGVAEMAVGSSWGERAIEGDKSRLGNEKKTIPHRENWGTDKHVQQTAKPKKPQCGFHEVLFDFCGSLPPYGENPNGVFNPKKGATPRPLVKVSTKRTRAPTGFPC